ncbi:hypothetical protein Q5752_006656 [Cryptotrichosporon argae]
MSLPPEQSTSARGMATSTPPPEPPSSGSSTPAGRSAYPQPALAPPLVRTHLTSTALGTAPPAVSTRTLAAHLAQHPTHSAARAVRHVFPAPNPVRRLARRFRVKHSVIDGLSDKEMRHWEAEGPALRRRAGWRLASDTDTAAGAEGSGSVSAAAPEGVLVSELFWKMYLSLLPTVERDPLSGLVSPDLLGSTTTMPLSIISLIPDIMRHYRDVIVRAEKEVFLATNYWQPSNSVNTISQALRDLSARIVKEGKPKVVVKVMYDRGSWEQLWNAHAPVPPKGWTPLKFPAEDEIPGLHMEVINFHKVLLGTFHAKFLIVDRKVALINSNNIQDRPNLELMSHLEGPIVDAFYEVALHSWHNKLAPPLPCIDKPYQPPRDADGNIRYLFSDANPFFVDIEILKAARAARLLLRRQTKALDEEQDDSHTRERFRDIVRHAVENQRMSLAQTQEGLVRDFRDLRDRIVASGFGSRPNSRPNSRRPSAQDLTKLAHFTDPETAAITAANLHVTDDNTSTLVGDSPPSPSPHKSKTMPVDRPHAHFADAERSPSADEMHNGDIPLGARTQTADAKTSPVKALDFEQPGHRPIFDDHAIVDSPRASVASLGTHPVDGHGDALPATAQMPDEMPAMPKAVSQLRESTDELKLVSRLSADEVIPPGTGSKRMFKLSTRFNAGALSEAWATVEDSDDLDNFRPHVVHAPHAPFPIAMCCRKPHGMPGHQDIRNPQNAAWLAGFRYAKRKVFVQTPTLNARPVVRAVKQACRRGVEVTLLLDLGFNDKGESIPFQGGTNEEVVDRLYGILGKEGKSQHLKVYWYTGKDQVRPLNAVKKQRNCHIKLAVYDDEVMIIGNGNQDSQSWFHSQEVNVMIDSKQVVAEMMDTLLSNQNTMQYGGVGADGVWRDADGKTLEDHGATAKGTFRGLSGFIAFAKTI